MARLGHDIEYIFCWSGVKLAQMLPARLADGMGAGLGALAGTVLTSRRRIAWVNLKRAMQDELTPSERKRIVSLVFRNTGRTLVEFARLGKTVSRGLGTTIVSDGLRNLKRVHDEGRGGIIVTGHFGSWELMGAWLGTLGFPMHFLTGVQHNRKVDELLNGFRREMGVHLIPINRSIKGVYRALKANGFVGLIADQHAPAGVVVDFFGRKAATPKGPAAFAVRAGAPVLPFLMRRESYDKHVVLAGEPIYPPGTGNDDDDIRTVTAAYTSYFETVIRRYPDQWLWTHRRWKV